MELKNWLYFCIAAFFAAISPGPSVFHAMKVAGIEGFKSSTASILGNTISILLICIISSTGLILVADYSKFFYVLKIIGALYLVYIGLKFFIKIKPSNINNIEILNIKSFYKNNFLESVTISLLNPKIFIFIAAFFPQFLSESGDKLTELFIMTITFVFFTSTTLLLYVLISRLFCKNKITQVIIEKGSGVALIIFGVFTLIS